MNIYTDSRHWLINVATQLNIKIDKRTKTSTIKQTIVDAVK